MRTLFYALVSLALPLTTLKPPPARPADAGAVAADAHVWRLVNGRNWQIVASPLETADETDLREGTRGACSAGMVLVAGRMKVRAAAASIDDLQLSTCTQWVDRRYPERCAQFDEAAWRLATAHLPTREMRFCIDRFEYPNEFGAYPIIDVTWSEAVSLCGKQAKRLCSEREWTFACEGEDATPYPSGFTRDKVASVIDREWRVVDPGPLHQRASSQVRVELDRLWDGAPSGSHPRDKSSFGVYDLTGNVDEWTTSARSEGRRSVMKGGYWGPVRDRCRPSTRAHGQDYSSYQQGFRCCQEPPSASSG